MRKTILVLVLFVFIYLLLTDTYKPQTPVKTENSPIHDDHMPRSTSIFSMETGDMEYLFLERKAAE